MQRLFTAAVAIGLCAATAASAQTSAPQYGSPPSAPSSPMTTMPAPAAPSTGMTAQPGAGAADLSSPESIRQAQQQLRSQGLYRGSVDGVLGPETLAAISQFQQRNNLPQTATLDQQTLDRLLSGAGARSGSGSGSTAPPSHQTPPSSVPRAAPAPSGDMPR